jgi:hypothetical protein
MCPCLPGVGHADLSADHHGARSRAHRTAQLARCRVSRRSLALACRAGRRRTRAPAPPASLRSCALATTPRSAAVAAAAGSRPQAAPPARPGPLTPSWSNTVGRAAGCRCVQGSDGDGDREGMRGGLQRIAGARPLRVPCRSLRNECAELRLAARASVVSGWLALGQQVARSCRPAAEPSSTS